MKTHNLVQKTTANATLASKQNKNNIIEVNKPPNASTRVNITKV